MIDDPADRLWRRAAWVCAALIAADIALILSQGTERFAVPPESGSSSEWGNFIIGALPLISLPLVLLAARTTLVRARFGYLALPVLFHYGHASILLVIMPLLESGRGPGWSMESLYSAHLGFVGASATGFGIHFGRRGPIWRAIGWLSVPLLVYGGLMGGFAVVRFLIKGQDAWLRFIGEFLALVPAVLMVRVLRRNAYRSQWGGQTIMITAVGVNLIGAIGYLVTDPDLLGGLNSLFGASWIFLLDLLALTAFLEFMTLEPDDV